MPSTFIACLTGIRHIAVGMPGMDSYNADHARRDMPALDRDDGHM